MDTTSTVAAAQADANASDAELKAADANVTATAAAMAAATKTQFEAKLQNVAIHGALLAVKGAADVEKLTVASLSAAQPSGKSTRKEIIVWGSIAIILFGVIAYLILRH